MNLSRKLWVCLLGKSLEKNLSVQDGSGQGHQLWLQVVGWARCHFRALPISGFCSCIIVCINGVIPNYPIYTLYVSINMDNTFLSILLVKVLNTNVTRPLPITVLHSELIASQNTYGVIFHYDGEQGKADGRVMLLIWWSFPGSLNKWNWMCGHCIQTFRAFKVQFRLCQTEGSWGKNPFIPPRLLNHDPRDHIDLKLPPGSLVDQFSLSGLKEKDELSLKLCRCFSWTCCPSVRDVGPIQTGFANLQIRWGWDELGDWDIYTLLHIKQITLMRTYFIVQGTQCFVVT